MKTKVLNMLNSRVFRYKCLIIEWYITCLGLKKKKFPIGEGSNYKNPPL